MIPCYLSWSVRLWLACHPPHHWSSECVCGYLSHHALVSHSHCCAALEPKALLLLLQLDKHLLSLLIVHLFLFLAQESPSSHKYWSSSRYWSDIDTRQFAYLSDFTQFSTPSTNYFGQHFTKTSSNTWKLESNFWLKKKKVLSCNALSTEGCAKPVFRKYAFKQAIMTSIMLIYSHHPQHSYVCKNTSRADVDFFWLRGDLKETGSKTEFRQRVSKCTAAVDIMESIMWHLYQDATRFQARLAWKGLTTAK